MEEGRRRAGLRLAGYNKLLRVCEHFHLLFFVGSPSAGLVGLQTALQFKPSGYRLLEVGLNSRQVVQNHQLYRFVTAPLIHSSLPHLASNMAVSLWGAGCSSTVLLPYSHAAVG